MFRERRRSLPAIPICHQGSEAAVLAIASHAGAVPMQPVATMPRAGHDCIRDKILILIMLP